MLAVEFMAVKAVFTLFQNAHTTTHTNNKVILTKLTSRHHHTMLLMFEPTQWVEFEHNVFIIVMDWRPLQGAFAAFALCELEINTNQ